MTNSTFWAQPCIRKPLRHFAGWVVATLMFAQGVCAQSDSPKFRDYPGNPSFSGTPAATVLQTETERSYRTRLRAASAQPANFAGDHVLALWGCGMGCTWGAAVSLRTGRVAFLPGSVCCWNGDGDRLTFRADSRLLVAAGLINEEGTYGAHFYEFTGERFRLVKSTPLSEQPSSTDAPAAAPTTDRWIKVAESDTNLWHIQPGSLAFKTNKAGEAVVVVVGQITEKRNKQIRVAKWYVTASDCARRMGKLVTLRIDDQFDYDNEFVFGSSSVASSLAETICTAATQSIKKTNEGKSL